MPSSALTRRAPAAGGPRPPSLRPASSVIARAFATRSPFERGIAPSGRQKLGAPGEVSFLAGVREEFAFEDLAGWVAGQLVEEDHLARRLVARQVVLDV